MTDREKLEHIVQDIMGWTYFPIWDVMHTTQWALEHDEPMKYPYAFWNGQGISVFMKDNEDAKSFNPLHDLLVQLFKTVDLNTGDGYYSITVYKDNQEGFSARDNTMAEAICSAVLKTYGIEEDNNQTTEDNDEDIDYYLEQ